MSRINTVETPIINSPYDEPRCHWHIELATPPEKRTGRRLASYFFRVPERAARGRKARGQASIFNETSKGEEYLLDLANLVRLRLKEWRARDYAGATRVTRELLELWHAPDRAQRLFFAQTEAVETVLFLIEGPDDLKQGVIVPADEPGEEAKAAGYRAFLRYALKMATGSGKTTVMGMLAAWSILNKVAQPQAAAYSDTVLIVCPNVTIRDRLRELDPNLDALSLYRTRQLVPLHRMADLRRGEVFITNWHNLERRELGEVNGTSARVVKRGTPVERTRIVKLGGRDALTEADLRQQAVTGAFKLVRELRDARSQALTGFEVREIRYYESDAAFLRRVLGNRKGRASAILVMNDEAHHAYRRGRLDDDDNYAIDDETAESDAREATVGIEGLDRINKALGGRGNGIRLCIDLSATPFFIQGSGNEVGKPFPWVVSDFSLLEAIESGLVKIPQLPTQDIGGTETPAYFNVWRWVQEIAEKDGADGKLPPDVVMRYATQPIAQLADEWRKTAEEWAAQFAAGRRKSDVPPVFIIVCRDVALAKELYEWLANGKTAYGAAPEQFRNAPGREWTVRVDSRVAEDIAEGGGRNDEARRLRFLLETVGRTAWPGNVVPEEYAALVERHNRKVLDADGEELDGTGVVTLDASRPPGREVRCIISVAMLSEGWDATTVTHVVGLRPFGSQLLCEQVVGRALRRTSYAVDEKTGFFREETAKVFGVPFELIPFKVEGGAQQAPSPPANQIYAVPGKAEFEIEFPVVEGYVDPGITRIAVDWSTVPSLSLDPMEVPDVVLMRGLATADGSLAAYGPGETVVVTLQDWRSRVRVQQVAFALAKVLAQQWHEDHGDAIPMHRLFPQLLACAQHFLATRLDCRGHRAAQDVALNPYCQRAVGLLREAARPTGDGPPAERPVIPPGPAGTRSTRHVEFHTGRQPWPALKCHLNAIVADTKTWEQAAATALDAHPSVQRWVKNDHLGFVVPYRRDGVRRRYLPDFIAQLTTGEWLIVEIKGQEGDSAVKAAAAHRWCKAVNNEGRFGQWTYSIVRQPADLMKLLDSRGKATASPAAF